MSKLSKINDLAFDLVHEYMEPSKQFSYGKQIYDLSDEPELNENQKLLLNWLKARFNETEIKSPCLFYLCELYQSYPYNLINVCKYYEEIEVVRAFVDWIEQEEK